MLAEGNVERDGVHHLEQDVESGEHTVGTPSHRSQIIVQTINPYFLVKVIPIFLLNTQKATELE